MRESVIEEYLIGEVFVEGGLCLKFKSPGRRNVPDRIVILPRGRLFFVEVKAPGEKPTKAQAREHARLRKLGQLVFVVDSIEKVDELILGNDDESTNARHS